MRYASTFMKKWFILTNLALLNTIKENNADCVDRFKYLKRPQCTGAPIRCWKIWQRAKYIQHAAPRTSIANTWPYKGKQISGVNFYTGCRITMVLTIWQEFLPFDIALYYSSMQNFYSSYQSAQILSFDISLCYSSKKGMLIIE